MMGARQDLKKTFMLGALSFIAGITPAKPTTEVSVATLNVRNPTVQNAPLDPTELPWNIRMKPLVESILSEAPTVIGFQEIQGLKQLLDVEKSLPQYDCLNFAITNIEPKDYNVVCFRKEQVKTFNYHVAQWIARHPNISFTQLEDMSSPRMWTTICFGIIPTELITPDFCVLNTHLDWKSTDSRLLAVHYFKKTAAVERKDEKGNLLGKLIPQGVPLLALGDFNMPIEEEAYLDMTDSRYIQPVPPYNVNQLPSFIDLRRTFSNDNTSFTWEEYASGEPQYPPMIIDYIFAVDNGSIKPRDANSSAPADQMSPGGKWEVKSVNLINNKFQYNGGEYRYSDHRMLIARLSLPHETNSR